MMANRVPSPTDLRRPPLQKISITRFGHWAICSTNQPILRSKFLCFSNPSVIPTCRPTWSRNCIDSGSSDNEHHVISLASHWRMALVYHTTSSQPHIGLPSPCLEDTRSPWYLQATQALSPYCQGSHGSHVNYTGSERPLWHLKGSLTWSMPRVMLRRLSYIALTPILDISRSIPSWLRLSSCSWKILMNLAQTMTVAMVSSEDPKSDGGPSPLAQPRLLWATKQREWCVDPGSWRLLQALKATSLALKSTACPTHIPSIWLLPWRPKLQSDMLCYTILIQCCVQISGGAIPHINFRQMQIYLIAGHLCVRCHASHMFRIPQCLSYVLCIGVFVKCCFCIANGLGQTTMHWYRINVFIHVNHVLNISSKQMYHKGCMGWWHVILGSLEPVLEKIENPHKTLSVTS